MASAKEGEQKKNLAKSKIDTAKSVLPKQKQAELDKQKKAAEEEWQELMEQMQNTQYVIYFCLKPFIFRK